MALNLVGLWIAISTTYTFIYKHRNDRHRGGMKMSRAIPLTVAYLLGIAGGIALIQGSQWGMYIVTVSYTALLVTVVLGAWSTMIGMEQRELDVEQKGKGRQLIPMSAFGTKRTSKKTHSMSLFGGKADAPFCKASPSQCPRKFSVLEVGRVRFTRNSGHLQCTSPCPPRANSGR